MHSQVKKKICDIGTLFKKGSENDKGRAQRNVKSKQHLRDTAGKWLITEGDEQIIH